jgi:LPS-assembly lipoprotein
MQFARHTIFILGLLCFLSACGFQLRGAGGNSVPESWRKMYLITNNPNGELSRELQSIFTANGVQWLEREEANYLVKIGPEKFRQRNLSLNAQARAAEFELTLSTQFAVLDAQGAEVIELSDASIVKQMENDPRNVVGKAEEIRILRAEMRTELIQQILRRIGYFAVSTQ